ncbi:DUF397 domain-containing protein [Actinomadura gamaensis]|uniref:DUF397 domain-containing protein n=1 Tax=Actinomadura gamaensis TaxID=1763541 RepID=A0ABV9U6Q6_9ACTN
MNDARGSREDRGETVHEDDPRRAFRRSSRCGCESNCVEVAYSAPGVIAVRDSDRGPDGPVLRLSARLLSALKHA